MLNYELYENYSICNNEYNKSNEVLRMEQVNIAQLQARTLANKQKGFPMLASMFYLFKIFRNGGHNMANNNRKFTFNSQQVFNDPKPDPKVLLLAVEPFNKFVDGKVTNEVGGQTYTVVAPLNGYERYLVKVPDLPAVIKQEEINGSILISFENLVAKLYKDRNGDIQISCKADKAIIAK